MAGMSIDHQSCWSLDVEKVTVGHCSDLGQSDGSDGSAAVGWNLWREPCPHGETTTKLSERANRLLGRLRALSSHWLYNSRGESPDRQCASICSPALIRGLDMAHHLCGFVHRRFTDRSPAKTGSDLSLRPAYFPDLAGRDEHSIPEPPFSGVHDEISNGPTLHVDQESGDMPHGTVRGMKTIMIDRATTAQVRILVPQPALLGVGGGPFRGCAESVVLRNRHSVGQASEQFRVTERTPKEPAAQIIRAAVMTQIANVAARERLVGVNTGTAPDLLLRNGCAQHMGNRTTTFYGRGRDEHFTAG